MLLNNLLQPRNIRLAIGVLLVFLIGKTILTHFDPEVSVNISGNHNPLENTVTINGYALSPAGEGGKKYTGKLKMGKNIVKLSGPLIKTVSVELQAGIIGGEQIAELETVVESIDNIIKETLEAPDAEISSARFFSNPATIVYNVTNYDKAGVPEEGYGVTILQYILDKGGWVNITEDFYTNSDDHNLEDSTQSYIYGLEDE